MSFCYSYPHPAVTVDIAIFAMRDDGIHVLLIERARPPYRGHWALPGGFVGLEESLKHAAWRELREETGVSAVHLEQLHTFGNPKRDPRERVISVAYFSVIPSDTADIAAASDADKACWFAIDDVPDLAFDHRRIFDRAIDHLRARSDDFTMALRFMPAAFTLPGLQRAHEAITGQPVDKRNFRKRLLARNVIEPTGEEKREGAHRPARLYRALDRRWLRVVK